MIVYTFAPASLVVELLTDAGIDGCTCDPFVTIEWNESAPNGELLAVSLTHDADCQVGAW